MDFRPTSGHCQHPILGMFQHRSRTCSFAHVPHVPHGLLYFSCIILIIKVKHVSHDVRVLDQRNSLVPVEWIRAGTQHPEKPRQLEFSDVEIPAAHATGRVHDNK